MEEERKGGGEEERGKGERRSGEIIKRLREIRAVWPENLLILLMIPKASIASAEIREIQVWSCDRTDISGGMLPKASFVSKCCYFGSRAMTGSCRGSKRRNK